MGLLPQWQCTFLLSVTLYKQIEFVDTLIAKVYILRGNDTAAFWALTEKHLMTYTLSLHDSVIRTLC